MAGHALRLVYHGGYSYIISFLFGFFGVEFFFVLSGVLIGDILIEAFGSQNVTQNLKRFAVRRWLRTVPLYLLSLLIYWFGNLLVPVVTQGVPWWKYIFFLQNFYKVQPMFFGVSWSLSIEEWFYVLFPLCLFLLKKIFRLNVRNLFFTAIILFAILFLLMRWEAFGHYHFSFYEGVRKIAFFRLDSVAFGVLAAYGLHFFRNVVLQYKVQLCLGGILLLLLNQYLIFRNNYSDLRYFNTWYYTVLGLSLAAIFPVLQSWRNFGNPVGRLVAIISKISYSLYLIHWLVFKFLQLPYFYGVPGVAKFILFFIISFLLAAFTYRSIEVPIMKYRNRITSG